MILHRAITSDVRKARKRYVDINVIVTGHSIGGAMASFCALHLVLGCRFGFCNTFPTPAF